MPPQVSDEVMTVSLLCGQETTYGSEETHLEIINASECGFMKRSKMHMAGKQDACTPSLQ